MSTLFFFFLRRKVKRSESLRPTRVQNRWVDAQERVKVLLTIGETSGDELFRSLPLLPFAALRADRECSTVVGSAVVFVYEVPEAC